jgi:uncharacterized lipoprotein NlpE involved in copper resistance
MNKSKSVDLGAAQQEYEGCLAEYKSARTKATNAQNHLDTCAKRYRAAEEALNNAARSVLSKGNG